MKEPLAIVTLLVIGMTVFCSFRGFQQGSFLETFMFDTVSILRDKEYRRVITSGFIHADLAHLLFNMFSFYSFGKYIELIFGAKVLLVIYFSSIFGGSLLALYLHRHHQYRALGASGGVCGVIFASIFLLPGGSVRMFFLPFGIPAWAFAILFILGSFYGLRSGHGNIGHDAHLGGALVGLGVATVMYPTIILISPVLYVSVTVLAAGLLFYTFKFPPSLYPASPFSLSHWRQVWGVLKARKRTGDRENDERRLNQLLEKISREGLDSLTPQEKSLIEDLARKKRKFRTES
jgi:membrane associated rhomboid family serine protease